MSPLSQTGRRLLGALALIAGLSGPAVAQSLAPRAYWPAPRGTYVVAFGLNHQEGGVLTDPSLPLENLEARTTALQLGLVRFFDLAGRTASLTLEAPWAETSLDVRFQGEDLHRDLSGQLDLALRLAVNLRGAPSMTPEEFRRFLADPEPMVGVSLKVQAPTGQYDPERVVNLGTNRWSFRPEIGYLRRLRPGWILELSAGAWFYGDNDEFLGTTREQDPLAAVEGHLVRPARGRRQNLWTSLDLNFYSGGRTSVDGNESDTLQRNSRIGATVVMPFAGTHALKLAASTSLATEVGSDFTSVIVAWQKAWR